VPLVDSAPVVAPPADSALASAPKTGSDALAEVRTGHHHLGAGFDQPFTEPLRSGATFVFDGEDAHTALGIDAHGTILSPSVRLYSAVT